MKPTYNWDAVECKVVAIYRLSSQQSTPGFYRVIRQDAKLAPKIHYWSSGEKVMRSFFLHQIGIQVMMPVEFANHHVPTLVTFQSEGSKDFVYLRVTPGEQQTNRINLNSTELQVIAYLSQLI